jgi:hypothetical protein
MVYGDPWHGTYCQDAHTTTDGLMDTDKYTQRERKDSLLQCLTDCGE